MEKLDLFIMIIIKWEVKEDIVEAHLGHFIQDDEKLLFLLI